MQVSALSNQLSAIFGKRLFFSDFRQSFFADRLAAIPLILRGLGFDFLRISRNLTVSQFL
jgi:hypothetical protein